MNAGLTRRMVIASALLALIVGAVFVVLLLSIHDLRASAQLASHSRQELAAADRLEKLLVDLETGVRGFVITRQERFLEPWNAARAAFPQQARRLSDLVDSPREASRARRIAEAGTAYIQDYSIPLVNAARRGERSARSIAATAEGKRRVDSLRAKFDRLASFERAAITARQDNVDADARRAIVAGTAGLAGSVALIVLFGGYLTRAIVVPVRRAAAMAGRLAAGHLAVRLPETSTAEIGELERAFNIMGSSLEANRDEVRELAEEQAALRRVATLVARAGSPSEVFETVTREMGVLVGADLARMERYESEGTVIGVAGWSRGGDAQLAVGTRIALDGLSVAALVREQSGPVRVDSFAGASGPISEEARALGIRSSVGCPIVVEGRLWGVIAASSKREAPFPAETETQIAEFTELVAWLSQMPTAAASSPPRAPGSSPPPTKPAGASSAICTTVRSSASFTRSSR